MTEESFIFLKNYLNNFSPTGHEISGQRLWSEYIKSSVDDIYLDTYGTCVGVINPNSTYKVVLEAHADEVSWLVSFITKEGFIYLKKNGGVDEQISISKRVVIMTQDNGLVKGVLGWPATHIRPKDKKPEATSVYVDCGVSSKKDIIEMGINIGDPVLFDEGFSLLGKNYVGRGLDNRIGGYIIAEVAKKIAKNKPNFGVYFINAVQEEVGQKGAQMIAKTIKPNVAIVTDVCHDTNTPMITKVSYGDLSIGAGPVLSYAPSVQRNLNDFIVNIAKKNKIEIQRKACSNKTGTDADAIAYSGKGVATALVSLPMRYMHTSVETVNSDDVENLIELLYQSVINIKPEQSFKYEL